MDVSCRLRTQPESAACVNPTAGTSCACSGAREQYKIFLTRLLGPDWQSRSSLAHSLAARVVKCPRTSMIQDCSRLSPHAREKLGSQADLVETAARRSNEGLSCLDLMERWRRWSNQQTW